MAALTLTGFVLLGASRLLGQLADGRDRLRGQTTRDAARANGERLLHLLVDQAESSPDTTQRFSGAALEASFPSWCLASGGWLERCFVSLKLERDGDNSEIIARLDGSAPLLLWRRPGAASFSFLDGRRGWLRLWPGSIVPPKAIGVVSEGDTLVLRIGASS
jgi:hypothetical protein